MAEEIEVGIVRHYFSKIGVAAIDLKKGLAVGDTIHIKGATTDFTQKVGSMQIEHEKLEKQKQGKVLAQKLADK